MKIRIFVFTNHCRSIIMIFDMKRGFITAKKAAVLGILTAMSLVVFIIENAFPPLMVPGAKMGLANVLSLAALIVYGPAEAFIVVMVRTLLGSLFAGNISMLAYSLTAGTASCALSSVLMYAVYPRISIMSVSIASATLHNIVQNVVYVLISSTTLMIAYMPYLILIGALSGAIVGAIVTIIFKKVPMSVFERLINRALGDELKTSDTAV